VPVSGEAFVGGPISKSACANARSEAVASATNEISVSAVHWNERGTERIYLPAAKRPVKRRCSSGEFLSYFPVKAYQVRAVSCIDRNP
jgi:hypothetical protein